MKLLTKAWFPLISVPIFSFLFFATCYFLAYPFLTYDSWPIQMSSLYVIKLFSIVAVIVLPLINKKINQVNLKIPLLIWIFFTGIGLYTESGGYEGNQNSGLALYLFGFQLMAIITTAIYSTLQNKIK